MSHRRTPSKAPQEAKKAEELKHGLTDVEIGELREAFSLYDKDGEGEIAAANLQSIMNRLDPTLQPTTDELQELISEYDSTGEGPYVENARLSINLFINLFINLSN